MTTLRPICATCRKFFRPKRNGTAFLEGMPLGDKPDGRWRPYKLWYGDLWQCKGCGSEIIVGVGKNPVSEHFHPDFAERCQNAKPYLLVEDC